MANKNETTTKFNVDISNLKKGIQEANRQIKLANAEFKAASAAMDNWATSSSGLEAKIKQLKTTLDAQKTILNAYKTQLQEIEKEYGANSAQAENMRIKYENQRAKVIETQKALGTYEAQLETVTSEQKENGAEVKSLGGEYDKLKKKIDDQEAELQQLKTDYKNVATEQGETSDEAKALAGQIKDLSGELQKNKDKIKEADEAADKFDDSLKDIGDEANNTSSGGLSTFGVALGNLISNVVYDAINKMKELAKQTIQVGSNFDSAMSKVGAVSGASAEDLEALRKKAKEMGENTKFSATESAEAFNYMAMAGWKTEDMLDGINGILNLAAASGSDLGTTSDIVTDALTAMGYSAKDAGRLADVMAAASSNANTNVEMMGQTFQYAAPVVGALGYSMEDTAEQIGLMANAGIKGQKAGTALRSILSRLSAPPKEAATEMDKLGISLTDSEGNMKSLDEVMADLRKAFSGLSETEKTQAAKAIAGQEAMSGLLAIVNAAPSDVDKLSSAINNSNGAAEDMAKTMQDNLGGDLTLLKSKLEGVQISLYEKLEPALRGGVEMLDKFLSAIDFIIKHSSEFIAVLGGMAAAIGAYLAYTTAITVMTKGWAALTIVTKAQAAAQAALNAVMAANPIGLVIAAVAGLVTAFIILWNKSEAFRQFWIGLWENITGVAKVAWEAISGFFAGVFEGIKLKLEGFKEFITGVWEGIKEILTPIAAWINDNIFNPIISFFQPVINFFTTAFNIIFELAEGTLNAIKAIWGEVSKWFNNKIITPVKNYFKNLWAGIKNAAKNAWEGIKTTWSGVFNWFNSVIITPVKTTFTGLWDTLKKGAKNAWSGIKSVFSPVVNWFKDKFTKAWQKVKDVFSTGGKIFDGIKEGIVSAFKTVVNAIIKGINKIIAIPFNKINDMLDKIKNVKIGPAKPFKKLISRFDVPEIPELEAGGVLKKGQLGLLEGNGAEAVVPLHKNKAWIAKTAQDLRGSLENEGIMGPGAAAGPNITNMTFNQTNNSPKALSRLEIYRQTKNQLNFAKGV